MLVLGAIAVSAQTLSSPGYHQSPDKDGVYFVGFEVNPPFMVDAATVNYTDAMRKSPIQGLSVWSAIVGADGIPTDIQLFQPLGGEFDSQALKAINQSKFAPAKLHGKPVATHVGILVPFGVGAVRPTPAIALIEADLDPTNGSRAEQLSDSAPIPADTGPRLIHTASAFVSPDGLKAKYQGVCVVTLLVRENGLPGDVHVLRPLGMGLDGKAIESVRRYRFLPAIKDGRPIATRINVEVKFVLY
jgi:TonB family protein